jgi:carbonic anhydrase
MAKTSPKRLVGLEKITDGLRTFAEKVVPQDKKFFSSLTQGQAPKALFIGCSDSRVDPNLMTQSVPGELFIVRNAGALVPPYSLGHPNGETATIEYAVVALGVSHIIICGHTYCGAMTAVAQQTDLTQLPAMQQWLRHSVNGKQIGAEMEQADAEQFVESKTLRVDATIRASVLQQLEHLRTHPAVKQGEAAGTLHLHGWVYSIDTGLVRDYDFEARRFVPKSERWGH